MKVNTIKTHSDATIDQLSDQQMNTIKGGDNDILQVSPAALGDLNFGG